MKRKNFKCTFELPNGTAVEMYRSLMSGLWSVSVSGRGQGEWPLILNDRPDFEMFDWFKPLARTLEENGHADKIPEVVQKEIARAGKNRNNARLRSEREQWITRARSIEFMNDTGKKYTLADVMSLTFKNDGEAIVVAPTDTDEARFSDTTERSVQQAINLEKEIKKVASRLGWQAIPSPLSSGRAIYSNGGGEANPVVE